MSTFMSALEIVVVLLTAVFVWYGFYLTSQKTLPANQHKRLFTLVTILLWGWVVVSFSLGIIGFFNPEETPVLLAPAPNLIFIILPAGASVALLWLFSLSFRQVTTAIPQKWLIQIQLLRIVGLLFIFRVSFNLLPAEFGIPAGIGDFLTGIAAPIVAYIYLTRQIRWTRWLVLGWNLFGLLDLVTAVTLGLLTVPGTPFHTLALTYQGQHTITHFPLVTIPTFAVPLFILIHLLSLRQVKREWHSQQNSDTNFSTLAASN